MSDRRFILAIHQTAQRFYPGINNIRPHCFRQIVGLLEGWGISLLDISEIDSTPDEISAAAFTFDDGYRDNIEAIEHLLERGIQPAVFIPTGYIGRSNSWEYLSTYFPARHLNVDQIRALAGQGVEIGSHGVHHRSLAELNRASVERELVDSKRRLEEITGCEVTSISFPYGRVSCEVIDMAMESGYRRAYAMGTIPSLPERLHGFVRPRVPVYGSDDYFSLRNKVLKRSRCESAKDRIINMLAAGSIIVRRQLK